MIKGTIYVEDTAFKNFYVASKTIGNSSRR